MENHSANQNEKDVSSLLRSARESSPSPSPFMKTRILARVREERAGRQRLRVWKWMTASSVAFAFVATLVAVRPSQVTGPAPAAVAQREYVIHVDFSQEDVRKIARVEVNLPDGVEFVSKSEEIAKLRSLRLPMSSGAAGRNKLPFVVRSGVIGERQLLIRLLNENDEVVKEKTLAVKFTDPKAGIRL